MSSGDLGPRLRQGRFGPLHRARCRLCWSTTPHASFISHAKRQTRLGTISLLTIDDHGRPLNLGRKVRLATSDQWIAGSIWHQGCVIPGCDRPATWCHAHHQEYWSHGGRTDLANLPFVCPHHHHLIHDKHFTIHKLDNGTWQLTRPDNTTVEPVRYPSHHRQKDPPPD